MLLGVLREPFEEWLHDRRLVLFRIPDSDVWTTTPMDDLVDLAGQTLPRVVVRQMLHREADEPREADGVDELVGALAARRMQKKMTQAEVATHCAVSQATISRLEDGRGDPPLRLLLQYAHIVDMNLTWMLRGHPDA